VVRGAVVAVESDGEPTATLGARIKLSGPTTLETLADEAGNYSFTQVPPGIYRVDAAAPGLIGSGETSNPVRVRRVWLSGTRVRRTCRPSRSDRAILLGSGDCSPLVAL